MISPIETWADTYGVVYTVKQSNEGQTARQQLAEGEYNPSLTAQGGLAASNAGNTWDADFSSLTMPKAKKTVISNGDGTYTLTLSVTAPEASANNPRKANVVIIYDSSNSMSEPIRYEESDGGAYGSWEEGFYDLIHDSRDLYNYSTDQWEEYGKYVYSGGRWTWQGGKRYKQTTDYWGRKSYTEDPSGEYGSHDGTYFDLIDDPNTGSYLFKRSDLSFPKYGEFVYQNGSWVWNGKQRYNGSAETRMTEAQTAVKALANQLFSYNGGVHADDTIQLAFVEFATAIKQTQGPTLSSSSFNQWVEDCFTYDQDNISGNEILGGTNWEAALNAAKNIDFDDQDQLYIVFVSDGNPTFRITPDGESPNQAALAFGETVYGTGSNDTGDKNYNAALAVSTAIINNKTILYNIGIYGDATSMAGLGGQYFDCADTEGINNAFADIIKEISAHIAFSNVVITDGITSLTTSTFIKGAPTDFQYTATDAEGHAISMTDAQKQAFYSPTSSDQTEAGKISWDLGNEKMVDGATYSLSCVIWPSQEAYDLVAKLNNGDIEYDSLDQWQKDQFYYDETMDLYYLRTNTGVTASCKAVKEVEGKDPVVSDVTDVEVETILTPMDLHDNKVTVQKVFDYSLDPVQFADMMKANPNYIAQLKLMQSGTSEAYYDNINIGAPAGNPVPAVWPYKVDGVEKYIHISAGLMVSEEKARASGIIETIQSQGYKTVTSADGTTLYYILEPGYDYYFEESQESDYHFELEEKTWHPMVINGELKNVTIENGKIIAVNDVGTLTAKNELKGGILISKKVFESDGETEDSKDKTKFTVKVTLMMPGGSPYTVGADEGGYRINYGKNRPDDEKTDKDPDNPNRSKRYPIEDGTFTVDFYVDDTIQVANVDRGMRYIIEEPTVPDGYDAIEVAYINPVHEEDEEPPYEMTSNTSHQVEVRNKKQKTINITIKKTDSTPGSTNYLSGAVFELYRMNNATWTKVPKEKVVELDEEGQFTVPEEGITLTGLTNGQYQLREVSAPKGYIITDTEPVTFTVNNGEMKDHDGTLDTVTYVPTSGDDAASFIIPNEPGAELPATGGAGTAVFYLMGAILILSSSVMLVARKKA